MNTLAQQSLLLSQTILTHLQEELDALAEEEELLQHATVIVTGLKDLKFRVLQRYLNKIKERKKRKKLTSTWKRPEKKNLKPEDVLGVSYDIKHLTGLEEEVFEEVYQLVKTRLSEPRKKYEDFVSSFFF
jgi:hypothetical protein